VKEATHGALSEEGRVTCLSNPTDYSARKTAGNLKSFKITEGFDDHDDFNVDLELFTDQESKLLLACPNDVAGQLATAILIRTRGAKAIHDDAANSITERELSKMVVAWIRQYDKEQSDKV